MKIYVLIILCLFLVKSFSYTVRMLIEEDAPGAVVGIFLLAANMLAVVFQSMSILQTI